MNKTAVFKEVEKMALSQLENLVLFGESGLVSDGEKTYDFIFHAKITDPYSANGETSIIMPVLKIESDDRDEIVEKVHNAHLSHPDFRRYAVAGTSLKFCEVNPEKYGKTIEISRGIPVSRRDFFRLSRRENPGLSRYVMEKIRLIDKKYQAAS
jgi:hypothetical protein